jgi:hypothetical protein
VPPLTLLAPPAVFDSPWILFFLLQKAVGNNQVLVSLIGQHVVVAGTHVEGSPIGRKVGAPLLAILAEIGCIPMLEYPVKPLHILTEFTLG